MQEYIYTNAHILNFSATQTRIVIRLTPPQLLVKKNNPDILIYNFERKKIHKWLWLLNKKKREQKPRNQANPDKLHL